MSKNLYCKTLALGIIVLFIGVGIHPAFAVDTNQSMVNKASEEECWECREVNDRQLVILEKQIKRIEVYTKLMLVLSRYNPEINEEIDELSNVISTLKEELADEPFPIICDILWMILNSINITINFLYSLLEKYLDAISQFIFFWMAFTFVLIEKSFLLLAYQFQCSWLNPFP